MYRSYGIHWCLNVTTGDGAAVLIRAVTPLTGLDAMRRRRGAVPERRLADGPGKLTQALGITAAEDALAITGTARLRLEDYVPGRERDAIRVTPRIGISRAVEWPLRFLLEG